MTEQTQSLVTVGNQPGKLKEYIRSDEIMKRFKEVLGDRQAAAYISSVMIAVASSDGKLKECTPISIVSSALRAAALRLSVDPSLGHAYLVPYKNRKTNQYEATLIPGYKGLYHMAMRTQKYRIINTTPVYEGEEITEDRLTGLHSFGGGRKSGKIIGWLTYFEMTSGYKKSTYMTVEEIHEHAQRFAPNYYDQYGKWQKDPRSMENKTSLRLTLIHWGYFDPHDLAALEELEAENSNIEILPEVVTVEDNPEPKRTVEENLTLLGYETEPEPPVRVAEPTLEPASVKSVNTTPPANGNGNARPMAPEALKKVIAKKAGVHKDDTISQGAKGLMVGRLNALFAGDENKRHQFTKYLTGYGSTKDMPANVCQAVMDWMLDDEMAKREANATIAYLDGQNGQGSLI